MILSPGISVERVDCKAKKEIKVKNHYSGARLLQYDSNLDLVWIETVKEAQHKGHATELLNYIVTNILQSHETLNIKVADECTLGFYFKWLQKMELEKDVINDLIGDADDSGYKISIHASILNKLPRRALLLK